MLKIMGLRQLPRGKPLKELRYEIVPEGDRKENRAEMKLVREGRYMSVEHVNEVIDTCNIYESCRKSNWLEGVNYYFFYKCRFCRILYMSHNFA